MEKEYYKEYYLLERNNWYFIVRYQIFDSLLNRFLSKEINPSILNIGVATGRSSEILMKYGSVKSLEYDVDCYNFAREFLKLDIDQGSITNLPYPNESFDVVCAFDVLEHVKEDAKGALEMKRVCKKGGFIIISVPMYMKLWGNHDDVNHHYRRYSKSKIKKLFGDIEKIYSTNFNTFLLLPIFIFRTLSRVFRIQNKKKSGSDFSVLSENNLMNDILYFIFKLESKTLKYLKYPIGVSFLLICRNKY